MKRLARNGLALIVGCLLLSGTAQAGWEIHSRYAGTGGTAEKEVSYFQRDKIREESGDQATVMDFAARTILMIDGREKTYSVMTFDEFKKMMREGMRKAREAMDEMKRQGISVPGAPSRAAGKITVAGIAGATVAGYPCDGYRVSAGETVTEEIWVTKQIDLSQELGPAVWKEFEELTREAKKMGFDVEDSGDAAAYRKIMESGYPMKTVDKQSGAVHEVTRAEKRELPASLFGEPKGYAKVPFDRMTVGSSGGLSAGGGAPAEIGGQAADYGKQTADEARDAASRGAQEPVQEKKSDIMDSIHEGTKEGIKKLFKW
jgi:hypothetical protein